MYIIQQRLYLTADRARVVPDGDPEAAFLYAVPGRRVTDEEAARYGLGDSDIEPSDGDEEEPKTIRFGGDEESPPEAQSLRRDQPIRRRRRG